ncbi:MAG: undecaprenyl-phosphate glucose phosphotransferase [Hyphomicrobiales bacterium]
MGIHEESNDIDAQAVNTGDGERKWTPRDESGRSTRPHEMFVDPAIMDRKEVAKILAEKTISPSLISNVICLSEIFLMLIIGVLCLFVFTADTQNITFRSFAVIFSIVGMFIILTQALHLYKLFIMRDIAQQLLRFTCALLMSFSFFILIPRLFFQVDLFQPTWMTPWFFTSLTTIAILRVFLSSIINLWTKDGLLERRAIIVGGGKEAEELILNLERQPNNDIRICGIFDDRGNTRSPELIAGYPKLGTIPELVEFARDTRLDMLIVALPLTAGGRVREMLKKLWVLPLDIHLSAHSNKLAFKARKYSYIGSMAFVNLTERPITGWRSIRKQIFDFVLSAILLVILSPLMLVTAIAIKRDSKGPVFFRQKRHGFNNEVIDVWKFRSMYTDKCDQAAKVVVTKDDPRVTKVGAFIRKTSIDELPQLWNVLKGELSLVGPRPHAVSAHIDNEKWNDVVDGYYARHRVKPGVTGWAQINGWRGEVDDVAKIKKRTDYDLYYIENWSLAFDFYILAMTPFKLLNTKNAY